MTFYLKHFAIAAAFAAPLLVSSPGAALEAGDRSEVETIVREFLLENPEIILEMQQVLETRQAEQEQAQRAEVMAGAKDTIFNDPDDPVLGNPNGDVTLVEFFDYNCGFCRRAHADMVTLLESDPKLRIVVKEFPILGPQSQEAHQVAMAFFKLKPESYGQFMDRMLTAESRADEAQTIATAMEFGVSEEDLRAKMADPSIEAQIRETYDLANKLNITGTPSYVIGDEVVSGALGSDVLADKIANVRACTSTTC